MTELRKQTKVSPFAMRVAQFASTWSTLKASAAEQATEIISSSKPFGRDSKTIQEPGTSQMTENALSNPVRASPYSRDFRSNEPHNSQRPRRSYVHRHKSLRPYPPVSVRGASHAGRFQRIPSQSSRRSCMFETLPSRHGRKCLRAVTSSSGGAPCTCKDTSAMPSSEAHLASALASPAVNCAMQPMSGNCSSAPSAAGLHLGTASAMSLPPRGVTSPRTSGITSAPFAGNATWPWSSLQGHGSPNFAYHLLYASWEDDIVPIDLKEMQ